MQPAYGIGFNKRKHMKIIDAHAHAFDTLSGFGADGELRPIGNGYGIWATGKQERIIPEGFGDREFTIESLMKMYSQYSVEKTVLLQGGFLGFENNYVYEASKKYPDKVCAAGAIDPWCRRSDTVLENLLSNYRFRVFKFEVSTGCGLMGSHPEFALDCPELMRIYNKINDIHGILVFDLGSPGDASHQVDAVVRISETFKTMPIVICHLGSYKLNQEDIFLQEIRLLKRDNIFFDLAAVFWKVKPENYPYPTAQFYIKTALNTVGSEHLMWGSDVPSTAVHLPLDKQIEYVSDCLKQSDIENVFYNVADQLYFL